MPDPVVVVGGGIAGSTAAAALGAAGVEVVVFDAGPHDPYDRPPLSKHVLVDGLASSHSLQPPGWWAAHDVDVRTGVCVTAIDGHTVHTVRTGELGEGVTVPWSSLVLATGGHPRSLAVAGAELPGVVAVNDLDGALSCAAALASTKSPVEHVVVIGAGFIGCEAAAAVRRTGRSVTVLEAATQPLAHAVGATVADWFCRLHRDEGVDLRVGTTAQSIQGDTTVRVVVATDGRRLPADLVIVAIGIELALQLAESVGAQIDGGVVVDQHLRTSVDGVFAVGDIAKVPCRFAGLDHDGAPQPYRCEHYNVAVGHGTAVAQTILGGDVPYDAVPTWWTDQYDLTVNACGPTELADDVVVRGSLDSHNFVAAYLRRDRLVAGLACGQRRELRALRHLLERGIPVTAGDLADPEVTFQALDVRPPG